MWQLCDFRIPVSLAAPLGCDGPDAEAGGVTSSELSGAATRANNLSEYARHVVSGMLAGAPYILAPSSGGELRGVGGWMSGAGGGSGTSSATATSPQHCSCCRQ